MQINANLLEQAWAQRMITAMDDSFHRFLREYPGDPPATPAAWWHYYHCQDCSVPLAWDIHQPHRHVCPSCGRVYEGDPYDGCWAKLMNGAIVANMECAAVLAQVREERAEYLDYIKRNLLYFAANYHTYSLKDKNAGIGKVFPQSLTESIFIISMERCLRMIRPYDVFAQEELALIRTALFGEAAKLLEPQITQIHNIHAWMQAAVAACASVLGDGAMLERSIHGEHGWINQLEKGCREDGVWYEISSGYHFYTMNALMNHARVAAENGIDLLSNDRFRLMYRAPLLLAYPDCEMPAYNDCERGNPISIPVYEQIAAWYGDDAIQSRMDFLYRTVPAREVSGFTALPNPWPIHGDFEGRCSFFALCRRDAPGTVPVTSLNEKSFLLADSGIAVLQNDRLRVGMKATRYGGGHDHNDKISIDIYDKARDRLISYDVGTSGYGVMLTNEWQRTGPAHNLVVVNGRRQAPCDGRIVYFDDHTACAVAQEAYPGTRMTREIVLEADGFTDRYTVRCGEPSTVDYVFHCVGQASLPGLETSPVPQPLYPDNGYPLLLDLRKAQADGAFVAVFSEEGHQLTLEAEACGGTEVFVGACYGENQLHVLGIVILRRKIMETAFTCRYRLK